VTILLVGLDYRQTPLVLRERLYLGHEALAETLTALHGDVVKELVIVSTCNRLELYAATPDVTASIEMILPVLAARAQLPVDQIQDHFQILCDEDAVQHLMRVASGLESLVVGETEILGQITSALRAARHASTTGPLLSRLFHDALHAGKRARAETAISHHTLSVSHAAVLMARRELGDVRQSRVLIMGAGRMAELALWALKAQSVTNIQIINRSHDKAAALAARFGVEAVTWENLSDALSQADIVIAATSASQPILNAAMLDQSRRSLLIDISVPRNIDSDVHALPNVRLYDLDDLQMVVDDHRARRQGEVSRVEAIIAEELNAYHAWLNSRRAIPAIKALRQQTEEMATAELKRTLQRLPDLTDRERDVVSQLVHRVVNKFLHAPTTVLREQAAYNEDNRTAQMARLFGLTHQETGIE
jgi:glutamyl-tRNA reductase